jgi:hypothetical protein
MSRRPLGQPLGAGCGPGVRCTFTEQADPDAVVEEGLHSAYLVSDDSVASEILDKEELT